MGNICGKQSQDVDPFDQPGRTVGSTPSANPAPRASVPPKVTGQGRQLGGYGTTSNTSKQDARSAAASAAEERASKANQPKGKLGRDLAKEKQQTRTGTLNAVSQDERRRRDVDQTAEARNWN
ncbi:hypothetical protein MMC09_001312 [Bachmanniomyces sp. S44760]|nr:hypothetical protein [Bachmanniomyces sp. S44760]